VKEALKDQTTRNAQDYGCYDEKDVDCGTKETDATELPSILGHPFDTLRNET